jgi:signal transduction histidine kinase
MPSTSPSSARVANLLRLMHAVTHDLSNPLQALLLHATMGLEDAEPGSETAQRHEADVEATRRMRTLLRALQGLATAGERPRSLASALQRFADIFAERYARFGLPLEVVPAPEGAPEVSGIVEESLLSIGLSLGVRARRSVAGLRRARLHLHASGSAPMALAIDLEGDAAVDAVAEVAADVALVDASITVTAEGHSLVLRVSAAGASA